MSLMNRDQCALGSGRIVFRDWVGRCVRVLASVRSMSCGKVIDMVGGMTGTKWEHVDCMFIMLSVFT